MPNNQSMFGFPSFIQYPFYRRNPTSTHNMSNSAEKEKDKSTQNFVNSGHIYPYTRKRPEYAREIQKEESKSNRKMVNTRHMPSPNPPKIPSPPKPSNPFFHMNPNFRPNIFGNQIPPKEHENNISEGHGRIEKEERVEPDYIFEIMGIKLDMGDIMIVLLLYFLYSEGVEDQTLFFSLIFLLLS